MFQSFKKSYLYYVLVCITLLPAQHPYAIESGMVEYEILGDTQLTPETNLSIQGTAKLYFKSWGEEKLEEEGGVVITTGAIKHKQHVKRFEKLTKDKIIIVDYENKQLLERTRNKKITGIVDEKEGLVKTSQENVAGYLCDVWEAKGIKKCIYKGLVLKLEAYILDVSYVKVATKADFNVNMTDEYCLVPDYPVHQFGLLKSNVKTKHTYKAENFCKVLKNVVYDVKKINISNKVSHIQNKERKKFINHMAQDIYQKQKVLLPKLLVSMKKIRECLQTEENPFESSQCIEYFSKMKEGLGTGQENFIVLWDEKKKNNILDKIEDELIHLQSRMSCVERTKNITDLSTCLK